LENDNFLLTFNGLWDPYSQLLRGNFGGWVGAQLIASSIIPVTVSLAALSNLQFNAALTIATANVNASVSLTEFSADIE
jgi:hypothetical protein